MGLCLGSSGITVGHEMVGVVESVGSAVTTVRPGDRVSVNIGEAYRIFENKLDGVI